MDDADRAEKEIDAALAEGRYLARRQAQRAPAFRPNGRCHFCDETVMGAMLFCNNECEEDRRTEEDQLKRMGRT